MVTVLSRLRYRLAESYGERARIQRACYRLQRMFPRGCSWVIPCGARAFMWQRCGRQARRVTYVRVLENVRGRWQKTTATTRSTLPEAVTVCCHVNFPGAFVQYLHLLVALSASGSMRPIIQRPAYAEFRRDERKACMWHDVLTVSVGR